MDGLAYRQFNESYPGQPDRQEALDIVVRYIFLKELAAKVRAVIEPVMHRACRDLQRYGHGSAILKELQTVSLNGNASAPGISLVIFTDRGQPVYDLARYPHIGFVADPREPAVWVREKVIVKGGAEVRRVGEYQVDAVTGDLVERHIRDFLPEIFGAEGGLLRLFLRE